jgi:hypothetical protein
MGTYLGVLGSLEAMGNMSYVGTMVDNQERSMR